MQRADGATPTAAPGRTTRRRWPGLVAATLWLFGLATFPASMWMDRLFAEAGRPDLRQSEVGPVVLMVVAATVGAVLVGRRPRHPVGWLLMAIGGGLVLTWAAAQYLALSLLLQPLVLPGTRLVALWYPAGACSVLVFVAFVLLLTPTGSLPSPRWRWWARTVGGVSVMLLVAVTVVPGSVDLRSKVDGGPLEFRGLDGVVLLASQVMPVFGMVAVVVAAASLVVRFRHAGGVERQQLRWVALAACLSPVAAVAVLVGLLSGTRSAVEWALIAGTVGVVLAIGAAALRYRLYDLDRIVSRTVAYGLLTVLLGGSYAAIVLGLGQLVGRRSTVLVASATLAVAGAFQPARHRIQQVVDRRFNRGHYDAAETVRTFGAELREHVDLTTLTIQLAAVIDQTMHPSHMSLQLQPSVVADRGLADGSGSTSSEQVLTEAIHREPTANSPPTGTTQLS
jgi:hypothetical protein